MINRDKRFEIRSNETFMKFIRHLKDLGGKRWGTQEKERGEILNFNDYRDPLNNAMTIVLRFLEEFFGLSQ